jgi:hypothetical protein
MDECDHRRRQQILTQHHASLVRESAGAFVLKQGNLSFLSDDHGDVPWDIPHGMGFFFNDCRFLDGYTMTLNGKMMTALSSNRRRALKASTSSRILRRRLHSLSRSWLTPTS